MQDHVETLQLLREFIAALDRRLPQIARAGESAIAEEAARLKSKAAERIADLEEKMRTTASKTEPL